MNKAFNFEKGIRQFFQYKEGYGESHEESLNHFVGSQCRDKAAMTSL